jgi:undecaprenyl-diphosphatase
MSVWEAIILGVAQGITEFLPVSSSGHLVLLRKIFGINEPALIFDTAVHGGTLVAVIVVLWRDIWNILRRVIQPMTLFLIAATVPAVTAALFFKDAIESAFASGAFLGFAFLVTSALLFTSEFLYARAGDRSNAFLAKLEGPTPARGKDEMNLIDALLIGALQAVAIVPGISRSGATIAAALSRKLDRDFAARFSFLLSVPAILGALALQGREVVKAGGAGAIGVLPIAAGAVTACIVAFFSVRLTLKIVRERSLRGFAVYTGLLGLLTLADKFGTHLFF